MTANAGAGEVPDDYVGIAVRLPDATSRLLRPGDVLGRSPRVACPVDDPRVSEAHAMVSLRRGQLHLIALRRRFSVGDQRVKEARLRRGLRFSLAPQQVFTVERVYRPRRVAALANDVLGLRVLTGVASLFGGQPPRIRANFDGNADAHVWNLGDGWRLQHRDEAATSVTPGVAFEVAGATFTLTETPIDRLFCDTTQVHSTIDQESLGLVASYDSVEVRRVDRPVEYINGIGGRLMTELIAFGGPVAWNVLAGELWRDAPDVDTLRHRWDVTLGRLRKRLRELGLRRELIRTDGNGQVWLVLHPGDTVVDAS